MNKSIINIKQSFTRGAKALALGALITVAALAQAQQPAIVPLPISTQWLKGQKNIITGDIKIVNKLGATKCEGFARKILGEMLPKSAAGVKAQKNSTIELLRCDTLSSEAYVLEVRDKRVRISAADESGIYYGLQTLRQYACGNGVMSADSASIALPQVRIYDHPRFHYRGMLLDVVRHFFTVTDVKKVIDIMAMHKLNVLHIHLTDDQGWRIEIKAYPRLTEIGSRRAETLINRYPVPKGYPALYDGKPYGGFYTQDDVREIVSYAAQNYIQVIPEIEIPGHSIAALASYPELGCVGSGYQVRTEWGVSHDLCCPAKPATFLFWKTVLKEVAALFPSEYVHIGGDECPKDKWHACPLCQQFMKEHNIADEEHLQGYVTCEMEKYLKQLGKKMIGWDEILQGGVSQDATIMSWRGAQGGQQAAAKGNFAIMAPEKFCYLDYYQSQERGNEPLSIGGYTPVEKSYSLDPLDGISPQNHKYILGVQANVWTEYIGSLDYLEYMMLPRLAAISEVGWTYDRRGDFASFRQRELALMKLYDRYGIKYAWQIKK